MPLDEYDFEIMRRNVEPPRYVCAICEQTYEYWPYRVPSEYRQGPTCPSCTRHWGYSNRSQLFHKTERIKFMRLSALIKALDWQVKNARY